MRSPVPVPQDVTAATAGLQWRPLLAVAHKEFRDRLRNRWVLAVGLVFAAFSLAITWFGGAGQGQIGPSSLELTIASLVSLVIYLIPLIALLLGFDSIVGERERGSLDLLLALPVTRIELLLGKYLGLALALAVATLLGLAGVAVLLFTRFGPAGLYHYGGFMASSVLLGLAFLSLAMLLSTLARDRAHASGLAIAAWFVLVLVFDLVLLGLLVATGGDLGGWLDGDRAAWLLLLNPADVFRILNVFSLDDVRRTYGLASLVPAALGNPWLMGSAMAAWIALPLSLACWRFKP
ncbi:MAG: ABC transporter permease [Burkholderiaceae bacterium]|nr:ABC transporter permease [Burkholderiaceae bacterium]